VETSERVEDSSVRSTPEAGHRENASRTGREPEELVSLLKGQPGHDRLRFVGQEERQRRVAHDLAGRLRETGDQKILEGGGLLEGPEDGGHDPGHLGMGHSRHEGVLAPGEEPVHRGPAAAGQAGHVLQGGLGQTPTSDAAQRGGDDAAVQGLRR
jgi:hypothetical protein